MHNIFWPNRSEMLLIIIFCLIDGQAMMLNSIQKYMKNMHK